MKQNYIETILGALTLIVAFVFFMKFVQVNTVKVQKMRIYLVQSF